MSDSRENHTAVVAPKAGGATAYRIETPRLVLRCYTPADAPARKEAVDASRDHLLPFMTWAREDPRPLGEHVALLRRFRGMFDLDQDRLHAVFDASEQRLLGEAGLLTRAGPGARELAYWIRTDAAGQGFATEMAAALTRVCFEVEKLRRVDVQCDVGNERSAAVARRLGFHLEGTLRARQLPSDEQPGDLLVFSLLSSELPHSPVARVDMKAFDVLGTRLL
ncbi:GNAT family protein [Hyalangium sp.]|uniref:GNAT family N-acetyltransferase n=1 Tax=Hyalangium sp. TaxID=2028555 RepID=UPI002D39A194|nr:GNAT family protein [Hyalangium sp.]HYI02482.1 GNAT family protein [Hyalangium sp.]